MPKQRTGSTRYNERRKAWIARLDWVDETGQRCCRKKQVKDKTAGKNLVKQWIQDLTKHGSSVMEGDRMPFEKLAKIYESRQLQAPVYRGDRKVSGLRSWKTLKGYLKVLVAHFGRQPIRTIGYHDLVKYKQQRLETPVRVTHKDSKTGERKSKMLDRPRSLANVHRELALLRQIFTLAEREGWVPLSPFKRGAPIINLADETRRERILTREEEARISETTGWRYLNDEKFKERYRRAQRQVVEHVIVRLCADAGDAAKALREVVDDVSASPSARVAAARIIIELAFKSVEIYDLEARMEALEAHLKLYAEKEAAREAQESRQET